MADVPATGLFELLHAVGSVESHIESKLSRIGLSLPKLAALHQLASAGGSLPLGQLAERLSCVKSNVTQLIDRLEANGFVARAPDPNDRRSRLAVITDTGLAEYAKGLKVQQDAERELFAVLTPEEPSCLAEIVGKLDRRNT